MPLSAAAPSPHKRCPYKLFVHKAVDSTNDTLRRQLEAGAAAPTAVLAYQQTAGRGRLGRTWASPPGGVYLSLAVEVSAAGAARCTLSLVVAVALWRVLAAQLPAERRNELSIKWPNDLLCAHGKLAGILIESFTRQRQHGQQTLALVGVGINVARAGEQLPATAAFFSDIAGGAGLAGARTGAGAPPGAGAANDPDLAGTLGLEPALEPTLDPTLELELERLGKAVLQEILQCQQLWKDAGYSFAPLRGEYEAHLALCGQEVKVRDQNGRVLARGTVLGIDDNGLLRVQAPDGSEQALSAGEVTLR